MRVCLVSRTYPRDTNPGSGSVAYNLAKRSSGQVLYVAKRLPGRYFDPPPNVRLSVFSYREPRVPERLGRIGTVYIAVAKSIGSAWFLLQAAPQIIRFRPDIVHLHSVLTILFAVFSRVALRRPVAITLHGTDSIWIRKSRVLQWLIEWTVDVIFCVSHDMVSDMSTLVHNPKIIFIPNGVDFSLFHELGRPRRQRIVAVGHLKWQKGYRYLLQAMQVIARHEPELKLCIAGSGPLERELREVTAALGIEGSVDFLGSISHEDVADILNGSLALVMSSVSEGFPRVLLEAMACGTPVVTTDVGECAAVVNGSGYVVPAKSPEAIAEAVLSLITDRAQWQRCSSRAVRNAHHYTWDEVARQTWLAYEEFLG